MADSPMPASMAAVFTAVASTVAAFTVSRRNIPETRLIGDTA
jgi:hypothetical protein